jgi:Flp pilus assembly pilin Flp
MIVSLLKGLSKEEDGATLLEYTVLLGVVLAGVVAIIGLFGTWIDGQWKGLSAELHSDGGASGGSGGSSGGSGGSSGGSGGSSGGSGGSGGSSGGSGGSCIRPPPLC